MKQIFLILFFSVTFFSCSSKKYFNYDEIDYYFFAEPNMDDLSANRSKSEIDSFKFGVVYMDIPKDISDLSFIEKLDKIGYKKSSIAKSKFADIDKIFMAKPLKVSTTNACIDTFRDILIFKKNNKVVGTAKVCFDCYGYEIMGTHVNTENFGEYGDFEKLRKILRE